MTTDIFVKKRWLYLICSQALAFIVFSFLVYAVYLNAAESVWIGKSFYFLVSPAQYTEAGSFQAQLDGGAGYCFETEEQTYVVFAVYLDEKKGRLAEAAMDGQAELLSVNAERLYFKKGKEKKNKNVYLGALNSLYGCITALSYETDRLDNGATQTSTKNTLSLISKQFSHLGKAYKETFLDCAEVGEMAKERLDVLIQNVVYARDLRYLLCNLAVKYLDLTALFNL